MKKVFLITVLLASVCLAYGQDVNIKWGTMYKTDKDIGAPGILSTENNNTKLYCFFKESKSYLAGGIPKITPSIGLLNDSLTLSKSQEFPIDRDNDIAFNSTLYFGNCFLLVTYKYDKRLESTTFYYQKIDKDFKTVGGTTEVFKFKADKNAIKFYIIYSEDSSKLCFTAFLGSTKKENSKMAYKVYDANFKTILDKNCDLPNSINYNIEVFDKMVTNNGDVYLINKVYTNEDGYDEVKSASGKKDAPGYKMELLKITSAPEPKIIPIDQDGKFVDLGFLKSDRTGNPIVILNYSEAIAVKNYGIKFYKIDHTTDNVILKTTYEIPKSFTGRLEAIGHAKSQYVSGGKFRTDSKPPFAKFHYSITDFKIYDDLSMAIIYETSQSVYDSQRKKTFYWSGSIVVVNMNKEAKVNWISLVPKVQNADQAGSYFIGHSVMFYKDKIYLFYNDLPKNSDNDIATINKMGKIFVAPGNSSVFNMVEVDNQGKLKKTILNDAKDNDIYVDVAKSIQIGENKMFICGIDAFRNGMHSSNRITLGTIDFK